MSDVRGKCENRVEVEIGWGWKCFTKKTENARSPLIVAMIGELSSPAASSDCLAGVPGEGLGVGVGVRNVGVTGRLVESGLEEIEIGRCDLPVTSDLLEMLDARPTLWACAELERGTEGGVEVKVEVA